MVNVAFSFGVPGSISVNSHFALSLYSLPDLPLALICVIVIGTVEQWMNSARQQRPSTTLKKEIICFYSETENWSKAWTQQKRKVKYTKTMDG